MSTTCMSTSIVTSSDGSQREGFFHANGENKLLHPRNIPNQAICILLHYVSCFSQSVKYRSVQARFQKISIQTLVTP